MNTDFRLLCSLDPVSDSCIEQNINAVVAQQLGVLIVNPVASGDNVFSTIQSAIDFVEAFAIATPIYIAPGTYVEDLIIGAINPAVTVSLQGIASDVFRGSSVLIQCTTAPLTIFGNCRMANLTINPATGSVLAELILYAPTTGGTGLSLENVNANSGANVSAVGVFRFDNTLAGASTAANECFFGGNTAGFGIGYGGTGTNFGQFVGTNCRIQGFLWGLPVGSPGSSLLELSDGCRLQGVLSIPALTAGLLKLQDVLLTGDATIVFDGTGGTSRIAMSNCVWTPTLAGAGTLITLTGIPWTPTVDFPRFVMTYVTISRNGGGATTWVGRTDATSVLAVHEVVARRLDGLGGPLTPAAGAAAFAVGVIPLPVTGGAAGVSTSVAGTAIHEP